ncbi:zinc ribbon domain-containing protein [Candidatus Fermentibacteria bacterium]|nr:zinc ribbon domain-containing protein [Candidatus Fermentibacteria bacterium]
MPIYEYACRACGHEFEKLLLRSSQVVACPACEGVELEKKVSCFGFASKGRASSMAAATKDSSTSSCAGCSGTHCSTCH